MYLSQVRYGASVVGLERSHDTEGRGNDMNKAIRSADEEVCGASANA